MPQIKLIIFLFATTYGHKMPQFAGSSSASIQSPLEMALRYKLKYAARVSNEDMADIFKDETVDPHSLLKNFLFLKNPSTKIQQKHP